VARAFVPGDHGSTFGGQPLASAAALATLQVMEKEDLPARAATAGAALRQALAGIKAVTTVRGLGLLLATELDAELLEARGGAKGIQQDLLANGLVVNAVTATSLRFAPPLTVSDGEIAEAVGILEATLQ
jgi:acetylornithine/succinyldiaminopimelate/putrescine aminotransferase